MEESYVQAIRRTYPELVIETACLNQFGQVNVVLIVNESLVFRFARFPEGIEALQREVAILPQIRNHLTLEIPNPIYQNLESNRVGAAFIGYKLIPGKTLQLHDFQQIKDVTDLETMALQLATFLRELHSIPIEGNLLAKLPVADTRGEWLEMYEQIQQKLFVHMREDARVQVTEHFETFLDNPQVYQFEPVLRHGDFGTGNLIYDPASRMISGVIDFGMTTLGDPAIDFAGLFTYGESFCKHCYQVYPEIELALNRIRFYRGTFALQEALYGIETGNRDALNSGMANYS